MSGLFLAEKIKYTKDSVVVMDDQFRVKDKTLKEWNYPAYFKNVPAEKLPKEGETIYAFNTNIFKATRALLASYENQGASAEVWSVGKKASDPFRKIDLVTREFNSTMGAVSFAGAEEIGKQAMEAFTTGQVDAVYVVYNRFKNAAMQEVMTEQVLPIAPPAADAVSQSDYLYAPSKEEILLDLIPTTIKIQIFKALLDSVASEHGARMTAMHKATDNANSMRSELRLQYNKARQAAITNEILEIVAGAEALNG
jgi:F-type H+-transporting ATPase subunit gamma